MVALSAGRRRVLTALTVLPTAGRTVLMVLASRGARPLVHPALTTGRGTFAALTSLVVRPLVGRLVAPILSALTGGGRLVLVTLRAASAFVHGDAQRHHGAVVDLTRRLEALITLEADEGVPRLR